MRGRVETFLLTCLGGSLAAGAPVDYLRDVKPVLAEHCCRCHGASQQKSGLRLDTAALALKGGGVGYYPTSQFVHMDTGRVRHW